MTTHSQHGYRVTGIGLLSAMGSTIDEIWTAVVEGKSLASTADYSMKNANVASFLNDRRMLKAVSQRDGVGLAAVEQLKRQIDFEKIAIDPYRRGMFVGACPSTVDDNDNYLDAVERSRLDGMGEKGFGKYCMDARPTTLLMGLPNNVLCYGAIILDAKGPNNNFTNGEISALVSVHTAMRNLRRGRIDMAICGGYSSQTNEYSMQVLRGRGDLDSRCDVPSSQLDQVSKSGTIPADAGVFVALENPTVVGDRSLPRWGTVLGTAIASSASGPADLMPRTEDRCIITQMMQRAMRDAGLEGRVPEMIFVSGSGIERIDLAEISACRELAGRSRPLILTTSQVTNNLQEASGLLEIGVAKRIMEKGSIPKSLMLNQSIEAASDEVIGRSSPIHVMSIRSSGFGEFAAMVYQVDGGAI